MALKLPSYLRNRVENSMTAGLSAFAGRCAGLSGDAAIPLCIVAVGSLATAPTSARADQCPLCPNSDRNFRHSE
jgi:hypothetical protein